VDSGDNTVFPYTIGTGGQVDADDELDDYDGAQQLTSISAHGSYVYLTDAGATAASPGGYILPYTSGTSCSLNAVTGGAVPNLEAQRALRSR